VPSAEEYRRAFDIIGRQGDPIGPIGVNNGFGLG
jgi:hypothetical protein